MAITTVGRSKELKKAKEKSIKLNPMGKTAQKEAAMKKFPERKFKARAFVESVQDKNAPMKKARLEDSVRGKKMVFKKGGGRAGYNQGRTVQKTDTSGMPRMPQVPLNQKPEWKRRKRPKDHVEDYVEEKRSEWKRIRDGREIKGSNTQSDLEKIHKKRLEDEIKKGISSKIKAGFKKGGRAGYNIGGRANLLEEMGRIDARRHPDAADRAEKSRVIHELNKGYKSGGAVLKGKKVGCQIK